MNRTLQSIMLDLQNGTDGHNVTDVELVKRAVESLETFPMTLSVLQLSSVAPILQRIRRSLDTDLQKRIRRIIKAWQGLLGQADDFTIVPLHYRTPTTPHGQSNGVFKQSPIASPSIGGLVNGQTSPAAFRPPRNNPVTITTPPAAVVSNHHHRVHHNASLAATPSDLTPTRLSKRLKVSTSPPSSPSTFCQNEISPKPPQQRQNGRTSINTIITEVPKLAKVKSTAELIQEAGGCIDSITKDRILSNRIAKESDEFPRLVPAVAMRGSRKSRQPQQNQGQPSQQSACTTPAATKPRERKTRVATTTTQIPTLKPETVSRFAADFKKSLPQQAGVVDPSSVGVLSDQNHRHSNHNNGSSSSSNDNNHKLLQQYADILESNNRNRNQKRKMKEEDKIYALCMAKEQEKLRRQKEERKAKLDKARSEKAEREKKAKESVKPLVTNFMDDWPELTPLEELWRQAQARNQPTYHNGDTPTPEELCDVSRVDDLLYGTWECVSATRDPEGKLQPNEAIFSIPLEDDQLLHVLPWANVEENRQVFFEPGMGSAEALDKLTDLPEPW